MPEKVNERLNPAPMDQSSKEAVRALFTAQAKMNKALLALLVTKTTITQPEADAISAVGIKE